MRRSKVLLATDGSGNTSPFVVAAIGEGRLPRRPLHQHQSRSLDLGATARQGPRHGLGFAMEGVPSATP
jgi:hypothetical protein